MQNVWRKSGWLVLLAAGAAPVAFAAPGDHIRAGDATITPSVMTGIEAHSNLYLADGGDQSPEVSAMAWVLKPRLDVDAVGRVAKFDLGVGYGLKKFIDFYPGDDFHPENADRFSDITADLSLTLLPQSKIGGRIENHFANEAIPAELPTAEGNASANIVHTGNDLVAGFQIRPGSALQIELLGQLGIDLYDIPDPLLTVPNSAGYNGRQQYGPVIGATWKFLPKTSLVANFSYNFLRWDNNLIEAVGPDIDGSAIGSYLGKPDADAWRATAGVTGQFTQKLAASAQVGFGMMAYDEQSVFDDPTAGNIADSSGELDVTGTENFATDTSIGDGVLVNLQIAYAPLRGHSITVGYRKDFQDAIFTNYVAYNYVFLRYEGSIQNRLGIGGEFSYRLDDFHGEVHRGDQNILGKLSASYKVTPWMSAGASGTWTRRACAEADCDDAFYATQYDDLAGTLGATFTY